MQPTTRAARRDDLLPAAEARAASWKTGDRTYSWLNNLPELRLAARL